MNKNKLIGLSVEKVDRLRKDASQPLNNSTYQLQKAVLFRASRLCRARNCDLGKISPTPASCKELFTSHFSREGKRIAFTLAETLITLGIIGVVAAVTMSLLIQNYQKHVTVNRLKTAYSIFSQAVEQAKADNGGELLVTEEIFDNLNGWGHSKLFSQAYIDPYLKGSYAYNGKNIEIKNKSKSSFFVVWAGYSATPGFDSAPPMCTPNGYCYWIRSSKFIWGGRKYLSNLSLVVDINGTKGPNVAGRDIFVFAFGPAGYDMSIKRLSFPCLSCTESKIEGNCTNDISAIYGQPYWNGYNCSTLIVKNGWKITNDYPW